MNPAVEATGITKWFGNTTALDDVHVSIEPGSLHALVGRNGAGKSTLVSVLTGLLRPDAGIVRFDDAPAPLLADRGGWQRRVACVYQHSMIVPHLSVAENIFLNRQPTRSGAIDWPATNAAARALLDEWKLALDVHAPGATLSVEERQLVEIVRALSFGARFVILDEPTARLEAAAIARLFGHLRSLNAAGVTILYISHHLDELYDLCDTVTVLRDGRSVRTSSVAALPESTLIAALIGTAQDAHRTIEATPCHPERSEAKSRDQHNETPPLELENLAGDGFERVDLTVMPAEIVGIAGIGGSGKVALAETIAGLRRPRSGNIRVGGVPVRSGVAAGLHAGIGFVPRDRHRQGLIPDLAVEENVTLTIADRLGPFGWIDSRRRRRAGTAAIAMFGIDPPDPQRAVTELSGGNQQKVVFARALARDPKVLVAIEPTAGVDVRSKEALHAEMARLRDAGKAVVIVSDDLDDLRGCDRVVILFGGCIVAEVAAGWRDNELIARMEGLGVA